MADRVDLAAARRARPERTCVGCRQRAPQADLLRVVAVMGSAEPDHHHLQPGRGAYVHRRPECLDLAERRRAFPRALRLSGPLDLSSVWAQLAGPSETADQQPKAGRDGDEHAMSAQR